MSAPRRICSGRGAAIVLASGCAISLTALSGGMMPALADPMTETTVTTDPGATAYVTTTEYAPVTTPPAVVTTSAPATTPLVLTTSDSASFSTTTSSSTTEATSTTASTTASATGSEVTSTGMTTPVAPSSTPSNTVPSAHVTPTEEPQRLQAPPQDVEIAKASPHVEQIPKALQQSEIDGIKNLLNNPADLSTAVTSNSVVPQTFAGDRQVMQWQPDWVGHDDNFRPVIFNPLRDPLQIVYLDRGDPRILTIQPWTSIVMDLAHGAHDFTVIVLDAVGQLKNVAVGSVISGPPLDSDTKVPVVVKYSDATYKPIVVGQITDVGDDPNVGERKVLLDGATPAWGVWTQTSTGERQFEVHKTQQFPGIDTPAEGPLPGQYQLQLASASEPISGLGIILLIVLAVVAGLTAIVVRILRAKPRPRHERVGTRVQATSRPGGPVVVTVRDRPAHGEKTHAVRLAAHTDPGTLTIREVHDDHSRAE